jgi:predicted dehydrogenase
MHFALLGDHPDGLDMAAALVATGRHELSIYHGPTAGHDALRARSLAPRSVSDLEEVLAIPSIEAVIVAGKLSVRAAQLRRALQSERHVLCVHPPDPSPDVAYEAALIQTDTGYLLFPLLPDALHPAVIRLAEWLRAAGAPFRCLQLERWLTGPVFVEPWRGHGQPSFRDWTVLRALGGEIVEVSAFASGEEVMPDEPLLLSGRFEAGGLLQASILPSQREPRWRLQVLGSAANAELSFPSGGQGPSRLETRGGDGEPRVEEWPTWDPWPEMVRVFEAAVAAHPRAAAPRPADVPPAAAPIASRPVPPARIPVRWQDCVRALELDDAARRSVERRRASTLDFQEVSEAVGFKGTMTLVGCAMLWGLLLLLIAGNWFRPALWAIPILLAGFLALQLFRWFAHGAPAEESGGDGTQLQR